MLANISHENEYFSFVFLSDVIPDENEYERSTAIEGREDYVNVYDVIPT